MAPDSPERRRERLFFDVQRNTRYHAKRAGFLELVHRSIMFGILLGGSTAFAEIGLSDHGRLVGVAIAAFAALDLVFDYPGRARDHRLQYRRYQSLARDLAAHQYAGEAKLEELDTQLAELLIDEDIGYYKALNTICHNEVMTAYDRVEYRRHVTLIQRAMAQFYRFADDDFPFEARA